MEPLYHFDFAINKNCWNLEDSYGQICVHCKCCSKDKEIRYKARLQHCKDMLSEKENFTGWAYEIPELMEMQKRNVKSDIKYFKRRIRYYENGLKNLKENNNGVL